VNESISPPPGPRESPDVTASYVPPRLGTPGLYLSAQVDSELSVIIGISMMWDTGDIGPAADTDGPYLTCRQARTAEKFWSQFALGLDDLLERTLYDQASRVALEQRLMRVVLPLRGKIEELIAAQLISMGSQGQHT